jgi:bacteriocin leader peptide (microcyclamide/patellamide family)
MDKQNLMPQAVQPVNRITTGQLPESLAELSEEALQLHGESSASVQISAAEIWVDDIWVGYAPCFCSYDGDDAE